MLNPGVARGPDGHLYLFPRLVAKGNFSRIGIARVKFNQAGDPCGVERLGIALEPKADYERTLLGGGGCEDPRVTFVEPLQRYVMTYAALSSVGPRIAFAISEDLLHWKRLGLAILCPIRGDRFRPCGQQGRQSLPRRYFQPLRKDADGASSSPSSFPARVPRKQPAARGSAKSISITRAFGYLTVRCPRREKSQNISASLTPIIA